MNNSVKNLIISTAEEYKHSLGGDYMFVLSEINLIQDIKVHIQTDRKNSLKSIFVISYKGKEYTISSQARQHFTKEYVSGALEGVNVRVLRINISTAWESGGDVKNLFQYCVELLEQENPHEKFTFNKELHDINNYNCERLKNEILPSCDLISFFDILPLSLIRYCFPHFKEHLYWDEGTIPIRCSLLGHIASDGCHESDDTRSDSEEPTPKKREQTNENSLV